MGLSHYIARFTKFNATLDFDTAKLANSSVTVSVDRVRIGPRQTVAVNSVVWTSVDVQIAIFTDVSDVFGASVDVGGSA
jgi:hypothetical protein